MGNPFPANFEGLDGSRRLTGQVNFTDPANQPGGSGTSPVAVVRQTVLYTDLVPHAGGYRFASVHTFAPDDVIMFISFVCIVSFDDTGVGLNFQVVDSDNLLDYARLFSHGVANVANNHLHPLNTATDGAVWSNNSGNLYAQALVDDAFTIGVTDNGSMAGDGTAGTFKVVVVYCPA